MGWRCYWRLQENSVLEFDPGLDSIAPGEGRYLTAFPGHPYSDFFLDHTGHGLRTEMDPEEVQSVAKSLASTTWDNTFIDEYDAPESEEEFRDLQRMFQAYAEVNASIRVIH